MRRPPAGLPQFDLAKVGAPALAVPPTEPASARMTQCGVDQGFWKSEMLVSTAAFTS